MEFIGDAIFPNIDKEIISKMVEFSHTVRRGPAPLVSRDFLGR